MSVFLIVFVITSLVLGVMDVVISMRAIRKGGFIGKKLAYTSFGCGYLVFIYLLRTCISDYTLFSWLTSAYYIGMDVMLLFMTSFVANLVELKKTSAYRVVAIALISLAAIDSVGFLVNPVLEIWTGFAPSPLYNKFRLAVHGPFYFHVVFSSSMVVLSLVLLVQKWWKVAEDYKRRYSYVAASMLAVILLNLATFIFPEFFGEQLMDYSALACSFAAIVFYWSACLFSPVRFMYNHSIPLENRMITMFVITGIIGALLGLLICLAASVNYLGILAVGFVVVGMMIFAFMVKRAGYAELGIWILVAGILIAMPAIWLFAGGIHSGVNTWFVYEFFYIAFALKGRKMVIAMTIAFILDSACYIFGYYCPQYTFQFANLLDSYISTMGSTLVVGGTVVITVVYQKNIYYDEQVALEKANKEQIKLKREAEQANQAKGDFLASMSHEIRTPINAVLGMDEMILRGGTPEEIKEYAKNIKQAGNVLLSLINDVLDFSKIESGKMDIVPADYKPSSMINDLVSMFTPHVEEKGLELKTNIQENIPSVLRGDDVRVRQVLTNLLSNAIKYTHKGSITLTVRSETSGDKCVLFVSVKDTGIGVREEDRQRLFESFRRLEESRNRSIEGTGLGLSITVRLLELMGSTLELDSIYGEGSDFSFRLVQGVVDATPMGDLQKQLENNRRQVDVFHESFEAPAARILVVDDNKMNLMVFKGLLKHSKMQIDTVMSGQECLNKVESNRYDIIFMDHMMPEMDGVETVRHLHEMEDNKSATAKIVALTANAMVGAKEMYLAAGFDDFLAKPVRGAQLEKVILNYLPPELVYKKVL